jgi:biotin operon repressor
MNTPPDAPADIAWVSQSQILELCDISRATLNSWIKAGLDISTAAAGYKLADVVKLLIFAAARKHLTPQQMAGAWVDLVKSGEAGAITDAARELKEGDSFELVVDLKYHELKVIRSDNELLAAVRHPTAPRPVVVVDLAEQMRDSVRSFFRDSHKSAPPEARKRGRPKRAVANLQLVREGSAR